ncbi:MAG: dihydropteroate synthase [Syntrophales bacterium]|nr:dihydropteroate synthase [Syntrophales bacterium]
MLIIGEKINASIPSVGKAIADRDELFLTALAKDQATAGADFIDVNAGDGRSTDSSPVEIMKWLVDIVQNATDKPLCLDSDDPAVLEAALQQYRGERVMINSVNAEPEKLEPVGRIAGERKADLVALVMKEGGVPRLVEERMEAADTIMEYLGRLNVSEEHVFFDPLVLPISVDTKQGITTLKTIEKLKERYSKAKTVMGLSNISYGLPARAIVNRSFFLMAAAFGLDAAILNPLDARLMSLVKTADLLTDKDPRCKKFTNAYRKGLLVQ